MAAKRKHALFLLISAVILGLAIIEIFITKNEISFTVLYLIPVSSAILFLNEDSGVLLAITCAFLVLGIHIAHAENNFAHYWHSAMEAVTILFVSFIILMLRRKMSREKTYMSLVENALVGIFKTNIRGQILYANNYIVNLFEYPTKKELMKNLITDLYKDYHDRGFLIKVMFKEGHVENFQTDMVTNSGRIITVLLNLVEEDNGFTGFMLDITKHRLIESELAMNVKIDRMTGTLNRTAGLSFLESQMAVTKKKNQNMAICFIDLNGLKTINDKYGHAEGDRFIVKAVNIIRETLKDPEAVCRLGGDEFLLIFTDCNKAEALGIILKTQASMNEINGLKQDKFNFSFSYGLAEYGPPYKVNLNGLLSLADKEMYSNKLKYKNNLQNVIKSVVGENAGKVWQCLSGNGPLKITELKKCTDLDEQNIYLALGWLEREQKVRFEQEGEQTLISLI